MVAFCYLYLVPRPTNIIASHDYCSDVFRYLVDCDNISENHAKGFLSYTFDMLGNLHSVELSYFKKFD